MIILLFEHSFQHPGISVNKCDSVYSEIINILSYRLNDRNIKVINVFGFLQVQINDLFKYLFMNHFICFNSLEIFAYLDQIKRCFGQDSNSHLCIYFCNAHNHSTTQLNLAFSCFK